MEPWKLKEEAADRTSWRTRFGRACGPVVWQTTECLPDGCNSQEQRMALWSIRQVPMLRSIFQRRPLPMKC